MALLKQQAEAFRAMHSGGVPLVLANVWDAASARVIEHAGFPAIATSSAGVAFALGYPDGQKISKLEMMSAVSRIARAVEVPVTADVESGYGDRPEDAAATAEAVIEAGAVGMNLEDATHSGERPLVELPLQLEKIRAVREAASRCGIPLVLNARTDVYLLLVGEASTRYDETLRRAKAFRDAGADCIFVPGLQDAATIGRLVSDLRCSNQGFSNQSCPVNILAGAGSLSVPELARLGVARVSLGSGPMRASLGFVERLARELKSSGTYASLEGAPNYADVNRLMGRG